MLDKGASILARLKNKAKSSGIPYQQCLQLFFQEEFLRRLSKSDYEENLVLKGGLFVYTLTNFESRATVDADFLLRHMDSNLEHMDEVIAKILATPTGNNEVVTLAAKRAAPISAQRKYPGCSTQIIGHIKNVRVPFDVDIGVGGIIVPGAQKRIIQTQLDGFEAPEILTYSLESTIAEKFDSILQRFELTGRMKDFYDIYYLSRTFCFDGRSLQEAMIQTLATRGTPYDKGSFERVIMLADDPDMQVKWRYFLKNIRGTEIPFGDVLDSIDLFLCPVWSAIASEDEFFGEWNCATGIWKAQGKGECQH